MGRKASKVSELQKRIKYFQYLADNLPTDLEDRDLLYQKYIEHIEKIKKERG
jgi:hypothetical protein